MNTVPPGPAPDDPDVDPTGMRDVLASLPDPDPMPDHVAARIMASLNEERARGPQGTWAGSAPVADLAVERERRRPAQWMLAAAAVVAVGALGTVGADSVLGPDAGGGDATAQYSPHQDTSGGAEDDSGAEAEADADSAADEGDAEVGIDAAEKVATDEQDADNAVEAATLDDAPERVQDIDDAVFASGALAVLQSADTSLAGMPAEFAGSANRGALPPDAIDACVQTIGENPADGQWAAAPATINGSDVVVVGELTSERSAAWAVSEQCPTDPNAEVLNGPVALP
ncbi:hypothetical protein BH23ACT6_BH23ACT6_22660 [soil metagenome]